jgi:hypothetical protein
MIFVGELTASAIKMKVRMAGKVVAWEIERRIQTERAKDIVNM